MLRADQDPRHHFELLEALQHAVIATDTSGRITGWSASAENLYGWKSADVMGRDILEVTPSNLSRAQAEAIMQTLSAGDVWSGDFRVRRRSGEDFLVSVTDVPLLDDADHLTGVVGLSAPAGIRTSLSEVVKRFCSACNRVWPDQVTLEYEISDGAMVAVSDPHLLQLMALLMIRQAPAMNRGSSAQIGVRAVDAATFAEFSDMSLEDAVHIRFAWSDEEALDSPLKRFVSTAAPMPYAARLVQLAGGVLLRGFDQTHWRMMHLILPGQKAGS